MTNKISDEAANTKINQAGLYGTMKATTIGDFKTEATYPLDPTPPGRGFKLSTAHGGCGVICEVWPDAPSAQRDTIKIQNASLSGTTLRRDDVPARPAFSPGGHIDDFKTEVVYPVDRELGEERGFKFTDMHGGSGVVGGDYTTGIVGLADAVCDGPEESRSADKSLLPKQPWKLTDMHGARGPALYLGSDDYAMGVALFKARFSKCITKIQYARREVNCTIHVTVYEHGSLAFDLTDIQLHQKELTLKPEYIYTM